MTSRPLPSPAQASEREGFRGGMEIPGWELFYSGKVRDLYRRPSDPRRMLMVATDRLSAFDVVFAETIPDRGRILTHITESWVSRPETRIPCARITVHPEEIDGLPPSFHDPLRGRVTLAYVAERIDVEVVLRARLAGSGWREYEKTGTLWGQPLPRGLQKSSPLPGVFFTPTTKALKDEPITWERAAEIIGDRDDAGRIRKMALELFETAGRTCREKGVILADTKFEFGRLDGKLVLIDEVLTPDSSRFWPAGQVKEGEEPPSFDKEIVRAWLRTQTDWNRKPPPPALPAEILARTRRRYLEIGEILTGSLPPGVPA